MIADIFTERMDEVPPSLNNLGRKTNPYKLYIIFKRNYLEPETLKI